VAEESIVEFSEGKAITNHGIPSGLDVRAAIGAARQLGGKPYSLLTYNCEHFINDILGRRVRSPQLARFTTAFGVLVVAVFILRQR
jgi:hypothetical protein